MGGGKKAQPTHLTQQGQHEKMGEKLTIEQESRQAQTDHHQRARVVACALPPCSFAERQRAHERCTSQNSKIAAPSPRKRTSFCSSPIERERDGERERAREGLPPATRSQALHYLVRTARSQRPREEIGQRFALHLERKRERCKERTPIQQIHQQTHQRKHQKVGEGGVPSQEAVRPARVAAQRLHDPQVLHLIVLLLMLGGGGGGGSRLGVAALLPWCIFARLCVVG